MKKLNLILSLFMLGFIMNSCSNNDSKTASYPIAIKLTDAPGPYDKVNIDLQGVEVTGSDGKNVTLNVNKGVYNLLDLSNGKTALIASDNLNIAKIEQIRLILGPNNTVVIGGVSYPLSTPSAEQTGLKLQVHATLQAGILYSVLFDFDAYKSIVVTGNNTYKLKPVIRNVETAMLGSIKGKIAPTGLALVTVVNATDPTMTYSTPVNATTGEYLVVGLPSGTYNVTVTTGTIAVPKLTVINNVIVTGGLTTDMGIIAIL